MLKPLCIVSTITLQDFKDLIIESRTEPIHYQPRNRQQKNYFHGQHNNKKMSKDAFVSLHEVAHMLQEFVWIIQTCPDIVLCCGRQDLIDYSTSCAEPIVMSYDTTFCLGDFYLSSLVLQCNLFLECPIIPVAFVIHERKFSEVHSMFFSQLRKKISFKKCIIITDGEVGITQAIVDTMSELDWIILSCTNHIIKDVEF